MGRKIRFVHSRSIELAVHHWPEWLKSIKKARRELGWKPQTSKKKRELWMKQLDKDAVWAMALTTVKRLRLPSMWAGYWIACMVSEYKANDPSTYWKIRCPDWAIGKVNTHRYEKQRVESRTKMVITQSGPSTRVTDHSLPPLCIETQLEHLPDSAIVKIPLYLLPGLIQDPSPLAIVLNELHRGNRETSHPLAQLLQHVGKPTEGDWARRKISETKKTKLRDLYEYLLDSEYTLETEKYFAEQEDLDRATYDVEDGTKKGSVRRELREDQKYQIKARVRKRVNKWFKDVGEWPIPTD